MIVTTEGKHALNGCGSGRILRARGDYGTGAGVPIVVQQQLTAPPEMAPPANAARTIRRMPRGGNRRLKTLFQPHPRTP